MDRRRFLKGVGAVAGTAFVGVDVASKPDRGVIHIHRGNTDVEMIPITASEVTERMNEFYARLERDTPRIAPCTERGALPGSADSADRPSPVAIKT